MNKCQPSQQLDPQEEIAEFEGFQSGWYAEHNNYPCHHISA